MAVSSDQRRALYAALRELSDRGELPEVPQRTYEAFLASTDNVEVLVDRLEELALVSILGAPGEVSAGTGTSITPDGMAMLYRLLGSRVSN